MAAISGEAKMGGAMWQTAREIAWPVIRDCAINEDARWLGEQTSSIGVFVTLIVISLRNSLVV